MIFDDNWFLMIMNLIEYSQSAVSLFPPLIALGLAIFTRKVLLSLGIGIVIGALLLNNYSFISAGHYIAGVVSNVVVDDGGLNRWNMSIVGFLLLLGMMTALLSLSGGARAFALWAQSRIKTRRGSALLAAFLGVFIFVDDYFNSLAVGAISQPVTDRYKVSRAKLAYILDSTAAPMCVIMPASSWGAYIMTIISGILISHGVVEYSALGAYIRLIPMNFYAIFALLMVFVVIWFELDIGPMARSENDARLGQSADSNNTQGLKSEIPESDSGRVSDLILPIILLIIATVISMLYTGDKVLMEKQLPFTVLGAFENTEVDISLIYGGLVGLVAALFTVLKQKLPVLDILVTLSIGAKSMFGAILILFFAWSIGSVISDMKTGAYLSSLVQENINPHWLPGILFLLSGVMAFSTGTSWGTFGIMLPIAGDMAAASEISLILPMLASVLAGSVFGDHCSPISDTTILSSTGAKCHHINHVSTQLPYALMVALLSAFGFFVLGISSSLLISWISVSTAFVVLCGFLYWMSRRQLLNLQTA